MRQGMNIPVTDGFMKAITAGPSQPMTKVTEGSIGPSFFTPEQRAFRAYRRLYGGDDPNAGGYSLAQVDFDKETGTLAVGSLEATSNGWLGCGCGGGCGHCG